MLEPRSPFVFLEFAPIADVLLQFIFTTISQYEEIDNNPLESSLAKHRKLFPSQTDLVAIWPMKILVAGTFSLDLYQKRHLISP